MQELETSLFDPTNQREKYYGAQLGSIRFSLDFFFHHARQFLLQPTPTFNGTTVLAQPSISARLFRHDFLNYFPDFFPRLRSKSADIYTRRRTP